MTDLFSTSSSLHRTLTKSPATLTEFFLKRHATKTALMKSVSSMDVVFCLRHQWIRPQCWSLGIPSCPCSKARPGCVGPQAQGHIGRAPAAAAITGIKSVNVTEYSLESHYCLLRFFYTAEMGLEVSLDDFSISCPPNNPYTWGYKKRSAVEGRPFEHAFALSSKNVVIDFKRQISWKMFQLGECYQIEELREFCHKKIIAGWIGPTLWILCSTMRTAMAISRRTSWIMWPVT